eukprot:1147907-Pelagomonas_calceolata.AAC.2
MSRSECAARQGGQHNDGLVVSKGAEIQTKGGRFRAAKSLSTSFLSKIRLGACLRKMRPRRPEESAVAPAT